MTAAVAFRRRRVLRLRVAPALCGCQDKSYRCCTLSSAVLRAQCERHSSVMQALQLRCRWQSPPIHAPTPVATCARVAASPLDQERSKAIRRAARKFIGPGKEEGDQTSGP
eukprot:364320-Chlamydomonas_euryale.AAC.8